MPPRRRKPNGDPEPESERERVSPSAEDLEPPPPFFNTTFSTHRASPLYIGANDLTYARLQTLSQRLRDTLVGDVVRGVQVGLEGSDSSLGRAGPLEKVGIRWVDVDALLGAEDTEADLSRDLDESGLERTGQSKKRALVFEMRYENALCTAVLMPLLTEKAQPASDGLQSANELDIPGLLADESSAEDTHFLHLPLLLLRMPTPLKSIIVDFLSSTFDCRINPMRLGTKSLTAAWEKWIQDAGLPSKGPLAKDMVLTLGFYVPPTEAGDGEDEQAPERLGIKSIDIIFPADELRRFTKEGRVLANGRTGKRKAPTQGYEDDARKRKKLAGGKSDEGWAWREDRGTKQQQPFLNAVGAYLDEHLALDLFHPGVRVTKIACGGFVLSEGRIKVFTPPSDDGVFAPVKNLVADLIASAAG
ncbi:siroheme synthase [Colletotrichum truncatum]|uniref:Siroheme synthase n=1 Tax=Colletotrichum truncatum TaxID=5467 RepID=A0ACC3ZLU8_COLTU|nr:siroheme synthase [Colletotrichum truncatum]KAF6783912.1 siroheme synthase [Colletotrichum truncatum]